MFTFQNDAKYTLKVPPEDENYKKVSFVQIFTPDRLQAKQTFLVGRSLTNYKTINLITISSSRKISFVIKP